MGNVGLNRYYSKTILPDAISRTAAALFCIFISLRGDACAEIIANNLHQPTLPHKELIAVHKPFAMYSFNYVYEEFVPARRYLYTYTDSGQISGYILQKTTDWMNSVKRDYEYDSQNRLVSETHSVWKDDEWRKNWKNVFQYTPDGKLLQKIEYGWSIYDPSPEDGPGNIIDISYDKFGRLLYDYMRFTYNYNENGLLEEIYIDYQEGEDYRLDTRNTYTYNTDNRIIEERHSAYRDGQWNDSYVITFSYNARGLLHDYKEQYMIKGALRYTTRLEYTYGDDGRLESALESVNNSETGQDWRPSKNHLYSYTNEPVHVEMDDTEQLPEPVTIRNYPNPFNPVTTIEYSLKTTSFLSITVYNAYGQQVAVLKNEVHEPGIYSLEWDASNMPSGVYFCRLTAGTFEQTRKMTLVK